jgi:hypothetical protein
MFKVVSSKKVGTEWEYVIVRTTDEWDERPEVKEGDLE